MKPIFRMPVLVAFVALAPLTGTASALDESKPHVTVMKTPGGGIQPQAVTDGRGTVHLIFFKGPSAGGDLFYSRLEPGREEWTTPVRVNSRPGSAVAKGTIRGGQIALGKGGRLHVVWNGAQSNPTTSVPHRHGQAPLNYTRSDEGQTAFEPQRDLMGQTSALDGGATVAADREGNVYVAWHARSADSVAGEMGRRMWVARSSDEGETFAPERPAWDRPTGACPCCGTRALSDANGSLYLLYRAAAQGIERDMYLLTSTDRGAHFRGRALQPWRINVCPMSSESLAQTDSGALAAWETQGQVSYARVSRQGETLSGPVAAPGRAIDRKHPAVAGNARGEVLLAWTEGTGWERGGNLVWQLFDANDRPTGEKGTVRGGIPAWGLATVVARPDGGFLILH